MKYKWILFVLLLLPIWVFGQQSISSDTVYISIEIKGMACPYCAYGMERELKGLTGVDDVDILLVEGRAYIQTLEVNKPTEASLAEIIKNGGFTVGEIVFSNKPLLTREKMEE